MTSHSPPTGPDWEEPVLRVLRDAAVVESRLDAALRPFDLTTDRWRALTFVARTPGASMAGLIEALAMPSTSATRTVDALVELGAIFRTPHPNDRRRVSLHLSAQGNQLLATANDAIGRTHEISEISEFGVAGDQLTPVR